MKTRNIREVKVGDKMYDRGIYLGAVIEVLENVFALSEPLNGLDLKEWITFRTAESMGWNIENEVGVDDSEEVELDEMDINNILRALDYFKEHNSICNVWTTGQLIEKLNKMLKEKGNETN